MNKPIVSQLSPGHYLTIDVYIDGRLFVGRRFVVCEARKLRGRYLYIIADVLTEKTRSLSRTDFLAGQRDGSIVVEFVPPLPPKK